MKKRKARKIIVPIGENKICILQFINTKEAYMLIDELLNFCDMQYKQNCFNKKHGHCDTNCSHPLQCPLSCETCLEQVHFPSKFSNGRMEYNCSNLLNYYVCKYSFKYASEIEYAFNTIDQMTFHQQYNILSLGCGASPDLIALEQYLLKNNIYKNINYWGIDLNKRWQAIQNKIFEYSCNHNCVTHYIYDDVTTHFLNKTYKNFNILVIQYLISYFYNNNDINEITKFYNALINNVVQYMLPNSVIIINDVNSNRRGRDYFMLLSNMLTSSGIKNIAQKRYFNYGIKNDYMCYGTVYPTINILYDNIKENIQSYNPWEVCSSAQLIIELR